MITNKGARLLFCKECKRKRFCKCVRIPNHNFRWACSKGHNWIKVGITAHRLAAIMEEVLLPNIKNLFERDDTFFKLLKK